MLETKINSATTKHCCRTSQISVPFPLTLSYSMRRNHFKSSFRDTDRFGSKILLATPDIHTPGFKPKQNDHTTAVVLSGETLHRCLLRC